MVTEVRRADDDELCGFVVGDGDEWVSTTVFGGVLGRHDDEDAATRHVLEVGLAALADRWTLVDLDTGDEEIVCIQEARPDRVTVALGYSSIPGVPSRTLTAEELRGRWRLRRS